MPGWVTGYNKTNVHNHNINKGSDTHMYDRSKLTCSGNISFDFRFKYSIKQFR